MQRKHSIPLCALVIMFFLTLCGFADKAHSNTDNGITYGFEFMKNVYHTSGKQYF